MRQLIVRTINTTFAENYRPEWLFGLELDFYFESLKLAIEFQGGQHFTPVHGIGNLYSQRRRDSVKKRICKERGITLLRLEAADLVYSRFRGKLNYWGFKAAMLPHKRAKGFNKRGIAYRQALTDKYACPTAHRKGSAPRKAAFKSAFSAA